MYTEFYLFIGGFTKPSFIATAKWNVCIDKQEPLFYIDTLKSR